jgi:hypothetical protein
LNDFPLRREIFGSHTELYKEMFSQVQLPRHSEVAAGMF